MPAAVHLLGSREDIAVTLSLLWLQWRRSISLGDIVRLLKDAQSVVDVPERLGQLERNKVSMVPGHLCTCQSTQVHPHPSIVDHTVAAGLGKCRELADGNL